MKTLYVSLFLLGFSVRFSPAQQSNLYWTGEELLAATNVRMEEMGFPTFSYDELVVRLACQAKLSSGNEDVSSRVTMFLKTLVAKEKFQVPVRLMSVSRSDINLTNDVYSEKRISLPPFCSLEVHILHINPLKAVDAQGNRMKLNWHSIEIVSGLRKTAEQDSAGQPVTRSESK